MKKEIIITFLCFGILLFGSLNARAATCTVNALTDTGAGSGGASGAGDLRYCINQANANSGADVINVTATGVVMLAATLPQITESLTINGSGQTSFVIDGGNITGTLSETTQPFTIGNGGTIAAFNNLTVRNGKSGYGGGVAIRMLGDGSVSTLNLTNVTIDNNTAQGDAGGGIFSRNANVNIINSRIINNKTLGDGGSGGGIGFVSSYGTAVRTLFITGTTISGNSTQPPAGYYAGAGGIYNGSGMVRIENSIISGNTAYGPGGGIATQGAAPVLLSNVTISDNASTVSQNDSFIGLGGGISIDSPMTLRNCTVAGNSATLRGGGIYFRGGSAATLANVIVANNNAPTYPDTSFSNGTTIHGKNIFKTAQTGNYTYVNGGTIQVADPLLNALADNGGLTRTRSLQGGSPAIDNGVDAEALDTQSPPQFLSTDQRGAARVNAVDIGAYEVSPVSVVNNASSGAGSLRQAIIDTPTGRSVFFSPAYFSQPRTISLGGSALDVSRDVTINGPGANLLTIDGGNASRIFKIASGATLNLSGTTLKNGNANGTPGTPEGKGGAIYSDGTINASNIAVRNSQALEGGGIYNNGTLNLTASIVADCTSSFGAGIYNASGKFAAVDNSTVSGNNNIGLYNGGTMNVTNSTASGNTGGAIVNSTTLSLINSTVSGNQANGKGAGVYNNGGSGATVINSTVTDNRGFGYTGAGVWNDGGSFSVRNSIIDNNFSDQGYAHDYVGGLTNQGNNLIGTRNPGLAPLGNYGGATQTHALLQTSAALNAGNNCVLTANGCGDGNAALTNDQRGVLRRIGANVDIGAFERNITFNQSSLPNGNKGASYNQTLPVSRQSSFAEFNSANQEPESPAAPFTFTIVPIAGQSLPLGLSLASDGTISGTPTQTGTYTFTVQATDADGIAGVQQFTMQVFGPTAAMVSIGGRILTADGAGIRNALVTLTDQNGTSRTILSGKLGAYIFSDAAAGETYVVSVRAKRFTFSQSARVVTATEDLTEVNFTAQESGSYNLLSKLSK